VTIDRQKPTVSSGYISLGNTGQRDENGYYNGTINIKANVADA